MKTIIQNKNLLFLFLNGFSRNFLVMIPILTLYFQSKGLTMLEIMNLQVIFSILIVLLEVPSGYFADVVGLLFIFAKAYNIDVEKI